MQKEAAEKFYGKVKSFKGVESKLEHDLYNYESRVTVSGEQLKALEKVFRKEAEAIQSRGNDLLKKVHETNRRIGEADPEGPAKITLEILEETQPREGLFDPVKRKLVFKFKHAQR
jgi:hypothetical protein